MSLAVRQDWLTLEPKIKLQEAAPNAVEDCEVMHCTGALWHTCCGAIALEPAIPTPTLTTKY
eukprot:5702036-Amphidinium_carterae.1